MYVRVAGHGAVSRRNRVGVQKVPDSTYTADLAIAQQGAEKRSFVLLHRAARLPHLSPGCRGNIVIIRVPRQHS